MTAIKTQTKQVKRFVDLEITKVTVEDVFQLTSKDRLVFTVLFQDSEDKVVKKEAWSLRGQLKSQAEGLGVTPDVLGPAVANVEDTEGRRDTLLASGQLSIHKDVSVRFSK